MVHVAFGVWNGAVHDSQAIADTAALPALKGLETFNEGNPINAFVGDRGFFVFNDRANLLDALWHYMAAATEESCGKCTPCRIGTRVVRDALDSLRHGTGAEVDLDAIATLCRQITDTSLCGLGQTCAVALQAAIAHFRDRLEAEAEAAARAGGPPTQHEMHYVTAPCVQACPSQINVPRYIDYIKDGLPSHSLGVILQKYPMAATCGRVCVRFCEMACRRHLVDEAVGIKTLKRYVADQQSGGTHSLFSPEVIADPQPAHMRIAVIGAGPAGISCAYHLLLRGYPVDVFDANDESGGMAAVGIPSYRLPKDVLHAETEIITKLGGRFRYNQRLGRDFHIDDLMAQGYKAVFLGLGCPKGTQLGIDDEDPDLPGYETGIGFLLKVHDHVDGTHPISLDGQIVTVVGGGNVAMDCVRSAVRMGAKEVHLIYRRTRDAMPADVEEVEAAEAEDVKFHFLTNPTRVLSEDGHLSGVELVEMAQGEPDGRGRRRVAPVPGTEWPFRCDLLIAAIGQTVDRASLAQTDGIDLDKWGCIAASDNNLATSRPGVYAGGDCVTGPSTLIQAMAAGLKAARSIQDYLTYGHARFFPRSRMRQILRDHDMLASDCVEIPVKPQYRVHHPELDPEVRKGMFEEVEQTISQADAYREAQRCLRCYRIYSVITELPIPEGAA